MPCQPIEQEDVPVPVPVSVWIQILLGFRWSRGGLDDKRQT